MNPSKAMHKLIAYTIFTLIIVSCKPSPSPENNAKDTKPIDCSDHYAILAWTNSLQSLNIQVDYAFFGNSLTVNGPWKQHFPTNKICVLGYGGDDLKRMLRRVEQITAVHPSYIFLEAGINTIIFYKNADFETEYRTLADSIIRSNLSSKLCLLSMLPVNESKLDENHPITNAEINQYNKIIQNIADERKLFYIDLYKLYICEGQLPSDITADGIHLKQEAYAIWINQIKKYLSEH